MKRKKYTLDEFLYHDLPMGLSAGIIASLVAGGLTRHERNEMRATIAEQRAEIGSLIGEKESCAVDGEGEYLGADAGMRAEEAGASETEKMRTDLIFANMRACSYFSNAIELTTMRRNNCATAKRIHAVIDVARDYCTKVLEMVTTPEEKDSAQNALDKLDKLHKHHRISPLPCKLD